MSRPTVEQLARAYAAIHDLSGNVYVNDERSHRTLSNIKRDLDNLADWLLSPAEILVLKEQRDA